MKTVLRVFIILLAMAVVSGGFYLAVQNTALFSFAAAGDGRPAFAPEGEFAPPDGDRAAANADGQSARPRERGAGENGKTFSPDSEQLNGQRPGGGEFGSGGRGGEHEGASFVQGLPGVLTILGKVAGITALLVLGGQLIRLLKKWFTSRREASSPAS